MNDCRVLVAGIGNILLGDDGFGPAVIAYLSPCALPANVRAADFGIRGLDLVYALMDGCDVLILVDALRNGGAPGTLYVTEPDFEKQDASDSKSAFDAHGLTPDSAFALLKRMGGTLPKHVRIVGCEPETFGLEEGGTMTLSPPVARAVGEAGGMVERIAAELMAQFHA